MRKWKQENSQDESFLPPTSDTGLKDGFLSVWAAIFQP